MKKIKENKEVKWSIELTEEHLSLISRSLEFVSRFACGQIGTTYLPSEVQELFYTRNENGELDWDVINKRRDMFDALGALLKTTIHPDLSLDRGHSYGINKLDFSDNLYDIYKFINHKIHLESQINSAPDDITYNVNSYFHKTGNLPTIKLNKIHEK